MKDAALKRAKLAAVEDDEDLDKSTRKRNGAVVIERRAQCHR
jgi:hypothetical protein